MKKGRLAWVFWLLIVLAVLTSTATYAWVAMNTSIKVSGFELTALTDALALEISADPGDLKTYDKEVSFDKVMYSLDPSVNELLFVTQGKLPQEGGLKVAIFPIKEHNAPGFGSQDGTYDGTGEFFIPAESDITGGSDSFINITSTLKIGDSLVGYYHVRNAGFSTVAEAGVKYYYRQYRNATTADYVCVGEFEEGEVLSGRTFWGYAYSDSLTDPKPNSMLNVIDPDKDSKYCLKRTVYIRCAENTQDAKRLCVKSVDVGGKRNYLTDTVRVYFVAKSASGETATALYDHGNPETFEGDLFEIVLGDEREVVEVDIYVYFDGKEASYRPGFLTSHNVNVTFSIDDHDYE